MSFRPKPGESDEDLIRQNAEFLLNTKRKSSETEDVLMKGLYIFSIKICCDDFDQKIYNFNCLLNFFRGA